jgi:hypothetical protein
MDDRLRIALEQANSMVVFNKQRDLIKQSFEENCVHHENGHRFTVSRELINFVSILSSMGQTTNIIILDDFNNPCMIDDVEDFKDTILSIYFENSNSYYYKYNELIKKRSVKNIIGAE